MNNLQADMKMIPRQLSLSDKCFSVERNKSSYTKMRLRVENLPKKKVVKVLEAYGGRNIVWNSVKTKVSNKDIRVLSIDGVETSGIQLRGDCQKFMTGMNLQAFDIIDLDAYSVPYKLLRIIFEKKLKDVTIFFTFTQTLTGRLHRGMLKEIGYTQKMIEKVPELFFRNGFEKFKNYLAFRGVRKITYFFEKDEKTVFGMFKL